MTTLESTIEAYLVKRVKAAGGITIKVKPYLRGLPDRLVVWPHDAIHFVELKRPKGARFEKLQERWHVKLSLLGHEVRVLYTKADVDRYVDIWTL